MEFRNFLLAALHPDDAALLVPSLKEVSLSRGQLLFDPGELVQSLYFPSSACVSVVSVMSDGRAVETSTVGHESAVGLLDAVSGLPGRSKMFVQVAGSAMVMPSRTFRGRLEESRSLLALTLRHARASAQQSELSAACSSVHAADGRLARWLLMTQDRTGGDAFALTQDYMAIMTGVQRTTVSQMAAALKKAGVIDYSRGHVTVLDRPALIDHACECYTIAQQQFKELKTAKG